MSQGNLNIARRKLNTVLGEKAPLYFTQMKLWLQMKNSKEMFDAEACMLLNPEDVHFHTEFLLALLNKVVGLAETSISFAHERAYSFGINRKQRVATASASVTGPEEMPRFVAQEILLPDQAHVMGRFMLAAWDHDLEGVEDNAANIIVLATQQFLKNVLTAVISQRKSYRTKARFIYDPCVDVHEMFVQNSKKAIELRCKRQLYMAIFGAALFGQPPTIHKMEHSAALEMASSSDEKKEEPVILTLEDVYQALLANRNIIGSHSVYSINIERIANMLSHPST